VQQALASLLLHILHMNWLQQEEKKVAAINSIERHAQVINIAAHVVC
jgi:hypothetical protein